MTPTTLEGSVFWEEVITTCLGDFPLSLGKLWDFLLQDEPIHLPPLLVPRGRGQGWLCDHSGQLQGAPRGAVRGGKVSAPTGEVLTRSPLGSGHCPTCATLFWGSTLFLE